MKCEHTNSHVKRYLASAIIRAIQIKKTIPKPVRVTTIKTKEEKKYWRGCGDGYLLTVDGKWYVVKWYSSGIADH